MRISGLCSRAPGNVYSAALTAGELADAAVEKFGKIKKLAQLTESCFKLRSRYAVKRGAAFKIIAHRQRLIEHAALEHDAELARYLRNVAVGIVAAYDDAAAVGLELAAHDGYGRALSGSVDAEKGEKLAAPHMKRKIAYGLYAAEAFIQM